MYACLALFRCQRTQCFLNLFVSLPPAFIQLNFSIETFNEEYTIVFAVFCEMYVFSKIAIFSIFMQIISFTASLSFFFLTHVHVHTNPHLCYDRKLQILFNIRTFEIDLEDVHTFSLSFISSVRMVLSSLYYGKKIFCERNGFDSFFLMNKFWSQDLNLSSSGSAGHTHPIFLPTEVKR